MPYLPSATLQFDGSCRPNPGKGGCAFVLIDDRTGEIITDGFQYLGWGTTNNEAEYSGLLGGLEYILGDDYFQFGHLSIEGDSKVVIHQIKGVNEVRNPRLKPLHRRVIQAIECGKGRRFGSYSIEWIDRRYNEEADRLANCARIMEGCW